MKQEHRFVAELYRYLSPFVDTTQPVYLSLDGEAAKKGVQQKDFCDQDVPDLWFTIVGKSFHTMIEAKSLDTPTSVKLGQTQLTNWRSSGKGKHKPSAWVAEWSGLTRFYYWRHEDFLPKLDACRSRGRYSVIRFPKEALVFDDIRALALHILQVA